MKPETLVPTAWLALSMLACAPALDEGHSPCGEEPGSATLELHTIPEAPRDEVPAIVHIRVGGAALEPSAPDPPALWLIEGDVGSGYLAQLARDNPSSALQERFVPIISWWQDGDAVLAPSVRLEPGGRYTVVSNRQQAVTLDVALDDPLATLRHVWPPGGQGATPHAVWCGDEPLTIDASAFSVGPVAASAQLTPGAGVAGAGHACVRLDVQSDGDPSVRHAPPPLLADAEGRPIARLEPVPLAGDASPIPISPVGCSSGETVLGPGCATVLDDRLWLTPPTAPRLWVLSDGQSVDAVAAASGERLLISPLPPASSLWLQLSLVDLGGNVTQAAAAITTGAPMAHVVVSEVMANPIGPEPEQEWVEIYNDGQASASLAGWWLEDIGGQVALPPAELKPGAYALIVNEAFDAASPYDPMPPDGTLLLRVPKLGTNGLNNQGEPLTLWDDAGTAVSAFPALPKPKAGRSVARVYPKAADHDPEGFVVTEEGAATPGQPHAP